MVESRPNCPYKKHCPYCCPYCNPNGENREECTHTAATTKTRVLIEEPVESPRIPKTIYSYPEPPIGDTVQTGTCIDTINRWLDTTCEAKTTRRVEVVRDAPAPPRAGGGGGGVTIPCPTCERPADGYGHHRGGGNIFEALLSICRMPARSRVYTVDVPEQRIEYVPSHYPPPPPAVASHDVSRCPVCRANASTPSRRGISVQCPFLTCGNSSKQPLERIEREAPPPTMMETTYTLPTYYAPPPPKRHGHTYKRIRYPKNPSYSTIYDQPMYSSPSPQYRGDKFDSTYGLTRSSRPGGYILEVTEEVTS